MVTLRAFFTPAEAALAKSLLDDRGIVCALADENAYLYGGAPLAMPVRIVVAEEQAEEAARILDSGPNELGINVTGEEKPTEVESSAVFPGQKARNNPWEFLALAFLVSIPGVLLLVQKHPLVLYVRDERYRGRTFSVITSANAQLLGSLVLAVALFLVFLFFYVRRAIARDDQGSRPDPAASDF